MTIQQAKKTGKTLLTHSPTAELDVSVILQSITGFSKTQLLLNRDFELSAAQEELFLSDIKKRQTGLPVAYITQKKEFYGFNFFVNPDVLIPKPDTELLVDQALNTLAVLYQKIENADGTLKKIPEICDMCSGSGCVGISVLKSLSENDGISVNNLPKLTFVDISKKALDITQKNAENLLGNGEKFKDLEKLKSPLSKVRILQSNLFENVPFTFDMIITNPPYVPHDEALELLTDGRSEPLLALDGDVNVNGEYSGTKDGLALIKRLVPQCYEKLVRGGLLVMETGEYNAEETAELFVKEGFKNVRIEKDLNDMLRNVCGEKI